MNKAVSDLRLELEKNHMESADGPTGVVYNQK